jgi:cell division protein FtsB
MSTFSLYSKRFVSWVLTMFLVVVIISLSRGAWELWNLQSRVTDREEEYQALVAEKEALERRYQEQTSPFAVEREIRDKLNMAKPGEVVVIVPEELRSAPRSTLHATSLAMMMIMKTCRIGRSGGG